MEKHDLGKQIFDAVKSHLNDQGMPMRQMSIIDATWIAVRAALGVRTVRLIPEMHQAWKGCQWYLEKKVHIDVDKDNDPIHSNEVTSANVDEMTPATKLIHRDEIVVYAESGYQGIEMQEEMKGKAIGFRVAMRPGKRRALPDTLERRLDDLSETA